VKLISYYNLKLRAVTVAQVAKPARSQENAAPTGRLSSLSLRSKGHLRYAGPRNFNS
jgi:hypothetical protein